MIWAKILLIVKQGRDTWWWTSLQYYNNTVWPSPVYELCTFCIWNFLLSWIATCFKYLSANCIQLSVESPHERQSDCKDNAGNLPPTISSTQIWSIICPNFHLIHLTLTTGCPQHVTVPHSLPSMLQIIIKFINSQKENFSGTEHI